MLKGSVRKYLRGLAHSLQPAVKIGKEGLSDSVIEAINVSLTAHELIKVQILADRETRAITAATIEERLSCECVGAVGRMAILYRQHDDPERRKIDLPV